MSERERFEKWADDKGYLGVRSDMWDAWEAALSAAPTPPEVEPVAWLTPGGDVTRSKLYAEQQSVLSEESPIPLYTSPPSPKAEEFNALKSELEGKKRVIETMKGIERILRDDIDKLTNENPAKAEWDAEGNPLNLEAAARYALRWWAGDTDNTDSAFNNLRKFIKDES